MNNKNVRVMCVSHIRDVDGCVCAALIRCATESSFLLTNYGNFNECLKRITNDFDIVYICDLGINSANLEEFKRIREFAEVTYIDHHYDESLLKKLAEMDITIIHDLRDCAAVLTYNLFKKYLPNDAGLLAAYAAISDRLEMGPIAKKIIEKYDRDFILFEAMLLSYAIESADITLKRNMVHNLSRLEHPHQIEEVPRLALTQIDRIARLRDELASNASLLGEVAYIEAGQVSSGVTANLLLDVCDAVVGISFNVDQINQLADVSIRGKTSLKVGLGKITSELAEKLGGIGGGHPKASGARIPASRLIEFISAVEKYIK